jgi:hypothetical protein
MATQTSVSFDALLKERYQPKVNSQLNNSNVLLSRLSKGSEAIQMGPRGGKYTVIALKVGRNTQVGSRAEGALLPGPGRTINIDAKVPLKRIYANAGVTDFSEVVSESDAQAYLSSLKDAVDGLKEALKHDEDRQLWGSPSGAIQDSKITAVDATGEPEFIVTFTSNRATVARWVQVGQQVQLVTKASDDAPTATAVDSATTFEVTSVDAYAGTAVLLRTAGSTDVTTNKWLVNGSAADGNSINEDLDGLGVILTTAELHDVDPADTATVGASSWTPTIEDNGGTPRALTEDLLHQTANKIAIESGSEPNLLLTSLGVERAAHNLLKSQLRYNDPNGFVSGRGFKMNLGSSEAELVGTFKAPRGQVIFLNTKEMYKYEDGDYRFADFGGSNRHRYERRDQFELIMKKYRNIGTTKRNAQGVLKDINDSTAY